MHAKIVQLKLGLSVETLQTKTEWRSFRTPHSGSFRFYRCRCATILGNTEFENMVKVLQQPFLIPGCHIPTFCHVSLASYPDAQGTLLHKLQFRNYQQVRIEFPIFTVFPLYRGLILLIYFSSHRHFMPFFFMHYCLYHTNISFVCLFSLLSFFCYLGFSCCHSHLPPFEYLKLCFYLSFLLNPFSAFIPLYHPIYYSLGSVYDSFIG